MRKIVSKAASKIALRKEVRKRGRRSSNLLGLKKNFLWAKKKSRESVKVKLKKRVARKRITDRFAEGSSFKITNPKPDRNANSKIKIGNKNFGTC